MWWETYSSRNYMLCIKLLWYIIRDKKQIGRDKTLIFGDARQKKLGKDLTCIIYYTSTAHFENTLAFVLHCQSLIFCCTHLLLFDTRQTDWCQISCIETDLFPDCHLHTFFLCISHSLSLSLILLFLALSLTSAHYSSVTWGTWFLL